MASFNYNASYTCSKFHNAKNYEYKCLRGPVGSGKSVACCVDIYLRSNEQVPVRIVEDGREITVRWSKWLIGRHTFQALKNTTIETFLQWFGPFTEMHWSPPISGRVEMPSANGDGSIVRIDLVFYALESNNIENDLMSLELSGAWVNEATQVNWSIIDQMHGRIGRFQPVRDKRLKSFGVIMDTNSPDESNWWYRKEIIERPEGMLFFVQPPALLYHDQGGKRWYEPNDGRNPSVRPAENVENLAEGYNYWIKQTVGADFDKVKRLILNQFGTKIDGRPVYPEYKDEIHCPRNGDFKQQRGLTLLMGTDFGRTPSTVIAQLGQDGVLRILDEVTSDNMGVEEFVETMLLPKLINEYNFPCPHINFADPAGLNKGQEFNISCIQVMNRHGINTQPAPNTNGNRFDIRREAVSEVLRRSYKDIPALQLSSKCKMLRKGFNGYYCYRRLRTGSDGDERYTEEADKNMYSHIHDALQYLCMGCFKAGIDFSTPTFQTEKNNFINMESGTDFGCI